jgi:DNA-binding MarR family transcriptional regulator
MARDADLLALDERLNTLASLYQFRPLDRRTFGSLTVSQSYCLRALYLQGPRSMGDLAGALDVRFSTMTGIIDQLEAKGLVERTDHPADRRSLHVRLTAKGRRVYGEAHDAFLLHLEPLLRGRSASARADILAFLDELLLMVHGWRTNPRKAPRRGRAHS